MDGGAIVTAAVRNAVARLADTSTQQTARLIELTEESGKQTERVIQLTKRIERLTWALLFLGALQLIGLFVRGLNGGTP